MTPDTCTLSCRAAAPAGRPGSGRGRAGAADRQSPARLPVPGSPGPGPSRCPQLSASPGLAARGGSSGEDAGLGAPGATERSRSGEEGRRGLPGQFAEMLL